MRSDAHGRAVRGKVALDRLWRLRGDLELCVRCWTGGPVANPCEVGSRWKFQSQAPMRGFARFLAPLPGRIPVSNRTGGCVASLLTTG